MRYVLGIDAGGTKTVGLLADETGKVVGETRTTGANLQTHGELEVEKVIDGILEALAPPEEPISAVCLGMAGVDRPHDERVVRNILRRLGHRERARVVNDAAIALVAGTSARTGVVILAGTGSICYGMDAAGRTARSGGYGSLLADEGSGYWLGHQGLRATVRGADGRGPETRIGPLIFEALGVKSVSELVPVIYEKGLAKFQIAALAPQVQKAAEEGDEVAQAVLALAADELARGARSVARQLGFGPEPYDVVLAGGVFKACPGVAQRLDSCLGLPGARLTLLKEEPARGAVALALDLLKQ